MAGTGTAYPTDGSPTFTSIQGRNAYSAAMAGATAARPLGGISGVRPGTPTNTITATSTTWTMNPFGFGGYIDLESSATNSGYFFAFSGTITGAVTAAGGSARTDIVWVRISDPNTSDGSTGTPRVDLDYTAGTTTPPARAFVIAQINVPATGGGSPTVTWVAPYTAAAGGTVFFNTIAQRDAFTPQDGLQCYVFATDQGFVYVANATTPHWQVVAGKPDVGTLTLNAAFKTNTGSLAPQVQRVNGRCYLDGAANILANGTVIPSGTNVTYGTIPSGYRPAGPVIGLMRFGTGFGSVAVNTDGTVVFQTSSGGTFNADTVPMGLAGISWPDARL